MTLCASEQPEAQTRWTLPSAYPGDNFHTENQEAVAGKDIRFDHPARRSIRPDNAGCPGAVEEGDGHRAWDGAVAVN
jgi:hypothetical protein